MTWLREMVATNPRMGSALLFSLVVHAAFLFLFSLTAWKVRTATPSELNNPLLARIVTARPVDDHDNPESPSSQPVTSPAAEEKPGSVITREGKKGEVPLVEQTAKQATPKPAEQAKGKTEPGPPFGVSVGEMLFLRPLPRRFVDANPLLEGQGYVRDVDLDRRPAPVTIVYPEYPPTALEKGLQGEVTVAFFVDEEGVVVHAWPVESSEEFRPFEFDLMKALRQSRFTPGMLKGKPVKSITFQTMRFDPRGGVDQAAPQPTVVPGKVAPRRPAN